jgi:hypothetical protein
MAWLRRACCWLGSKRRLVWIGWGRGDLFTTPFLSILQRLLVETNEADMRPSGVLQIFPMQKRFVHGKSLVSVKEARKEKSEEQMVLQCDRRECKGVWALVP